MLLITFLQASSAQTPERPAPPVSPAPPILEQPDAERTRAEFYQLLQRYPPTLRGVFQLDNRLLEDQTYLAAYPALAEFLRTHPEVQRNPVFFVGSPDRPRDRATGIDVWRDIGQGLEVLLGFVAFFCLVGWFARTLVDYKRWNRQTQALTDVHSRLMERLSGNAELLAYIQSSAGSKFLESSPIRLDTAPQSSGAPMGRIIWTLQAGIVIIAAGSGMFPLAAQAPSDAGGALRGLGGLAIALGAGFVISAIISFLISRRMGIIEVPGRPQS